jgi:hypothetical protein
MVLQGAIPLYRVVGVGVLASSLNFSSPAYHFTSKEPTRALQIPDIRRIEDPAQNRLYRFKTSIHQKPVASI